MKKWLKYIFVFLMIVGFILVTLDTIHNIQNLNQDDVHQFPVYMDPEYDTPKEPEPKDESDFVFPTPDPEIFSGVEG